MKNKVRVKTLFYLFAAFTLLALLPACTTTPGNADGKEFANKFTPTGAIDDEVSLIRTTIKRSALDLEAIQIMNSGAVLKRSPLELVDTGKSLALAQFASKINVVAYVRKDGEGVLGTARKQRAVFAPGVTLRRRIIYPDMGSVVKDFPHIKSATLQQFVQAKGSQIELTKWELSFYWVQSRDGKAFRIFMDNPRYLDHVNPVESEDSPPKKPFNALAVFSYRYPIQAERRLHITSVIFDMTIATDKGVYRGRRQSSGWLPLQLNTKTGPYSIQIGIIEASNIQSFFESVGGVSGISGKLINKIF
ncbi:MAG: hypothetical protein ACC641_09015 [Acidiferrobacterales bacterium]